MVRSLLMGTARLATVVSQGPMYVTFPASERDVIACKSGGKNEHLPIHIKLADGTIYSHPGITSFIGRPGRRAGYVGNPPTNWWVHRNCALILLGCGTPVLLARSRGAISPAYMEVGLGAACHVRQPRSPSRPRSSAAIGRHDGGKLSVALSSSSPRALARWRSRSRSAR